MSREERADTGTAVAEEDPQKRPPKPTPQESAAARAGDWLQYVAPGLGWNGSRYVADPARVSGLVRHHCDAIWTDARTAIRLERELAAVGWHQEPGAVIDWDRADTLIRRDVEKHGPTSRAEIETRTGLCRAAVFSTVRDLEERGLRCVGNWRAEKGTMAGALKRVVKEIRERPRCSD